MLRGALSTRTEPALLERYGRLLDSLGERYEAGKYLYLSGQRAREYADAIELFMARNAARTDADFVSLFPAAVRRLSFDQLPRAVQEDLKTRGVSQMRFSGERPAVPSARDSWGDRARLAAAVFIAGILTAALIPGTRRILKGVWRFLLG